MGLGIRTYFSEKLRDARSEKFGDGYVDWRARRQLTILDHYGHRFFDGKTLLELGAGHGDLGAFFSGLGAVVTCIEGREKNTRVIRSRYPHLKCLTHDLSQVWPLRQQAFDIIVHFGVLYHLSNPEENLREACRHCTHLILETEVCDSADPMLVKIVSEHSYRYDQAVDGTGSRPSPAFVERILTEEKMDYVRMNDSRCNSGGNIYDWKETNSGDFKNGQRRIWFAKKKTV